jgi:hypothetical protein
MVFTHTAPQKKRVRDGREWKLNRGAGESKILHSNLEGKIFVKFVQKSIRPPFLSHSLLFKLLSCGVSNLIGQKNITWSPFVSPSLLPSSTLLWSAVSV